MPEETNAVANFLNEISEPQDIFKEEESEPVAEESEEQEEGKPLPFHRDPKVQKYVEKQIEKALKDRPVVEQGIHKETEEINLPASFVELVGNDTPEKLRVLKDLSDYFGTLKGQARQEFLDDMKAQERQQAEAQQKAQEELDASFEEIQETYNVDLSSNSASAKQLRSQFVEYIRKIAPKDENGEVATFPDLIASFEEFQERNKRTPATRAKEVASRGMARSGDTASPAASGPKDWKAAEKYIASLKASN